MSLFSKKQNKAGHNLDDFDRIAMENEKVVYFTCLSILRQKEDAEDCTQQTMLNAYRAFLRFDNIASYKAWFCRIAKNVCIDFLRRKKPQQSIETMMENGHDIPDGNADVYHELDSNERKQHLHKALDALPPKMRIVIALRDIEGLSYEEMASTLSCTLGTVKSRVNRARNKLKEILEKMELFSNKNV